jgi:hypothetical protein
VPQALATFEMPVKLPCSHDVMVDMPREPSGVLAGLA